MFSIIIPLYNKEETIERTIFSVLRHNYAQIEIIVVDDGSTDNSPKIVQAINHPEVRYFRKENGGVSSARNYGIDQANGEWFIFLDADDTFADGALDFLYQLQESYPKEKLFVGGITCRESCPENKIKSHLSKTPYFDVWRNCFIPASGNMLIHRSLLPKFGSFDQRMSFFEDYEFALRMMGFGSLVYTNRPIRVYNQIEGGLSSTPHRIEKDMAYYLPERLSAFPFWGKVLWYENVEYMIFWNRNNPEWRTFYTEMRSRYFGWLFMALHSIRQRLLNHRII